MTAEEYWNSEGIRFLNDDGTIPTVEQRVIEGYRAGYWNGILDSYAKWAKENQEEAK
jgi:hypothetical protein